MTNKDQTKQKIINYLEDYIDFAYFQEKVLLLRKELGIPKDGFDLDKDLSQEKIIAKVNDSFDVPKELYNTGYEKLNLISDLKPKIITLINDLPITGYIIEHFFRFYIFYNKKIYYGIEKLMVGSNSANISEVSLCGIEYFPEIKKLNKKSLEEKFNNFPIIIKINPNVSQRDLNSYIKTNWQRINNVSKKSTITSGNKMRSRAKDKKVKERNDFIYKNKELPIKKIFKLVSEKFDEVLDDGHIGKIISLEKRRRKEV